MRTASCSDSIDTASTREIYRLLFDENWDYLEELCRLRSDFKNIMLFKPITVAGETVLHYAARDKRALKNMLKHIGDEDDRKRALSMQNYYGNTPLHMTASLGNLGTTELLLKQCNELLYHKNTNGETAMYKAATFGRKKVLKYLFDHFLGNHHVEDGDFTEMLDYQCTRNDGTSILHVAIHGRHIDVEDVYVLNSINAGTALWIVKNTTEYFDPHNTLYQRKDKKGMTCLQLLADMKSIFESGFSMNTLERFIYWCDPIEGIEGDSVQDNSIIPSRICGDMDRIRLNVLNFLAKGWPVIHDIRKKKTKHALAMALTRLLAPEDFSWEQSYVTGSEYGHGDHRDSNVTAGTEPNQERLTPLLLAASNGIIEIVNIILEEYPQAIDHISANQENILHVAIQHRQREIFRVVKKKRVVMESLDRRVDKNGNNILHQVGVVDHCHREGSTNPVLQLQDELHWFEHVKILLPDHYVTARNGMGITPKEYFHETHKDQLKDARNWTKDTSQSCSTVAALIATIVFAAAYTVPGGLEKGIPIFLRSTIFKIFTIMDIISLGLSLSSLILFLFLVTSPFKYDDFFISIPTRMMFGFSFLLISVASTVGAFTVTILLTVYLKKEWTISMIIYVIGCLPVLISALLHFIAGIQIIWRELKHFLPNFKACSPSCLKMDYNRIETTPNFHDPEDSPATEDLVSL